MEFNKAYDREEFLTFLKDKFLPEEDFVKEETVLPFPVQTKYSTKATRLGTCHDTLDLEVYEIRHTSKHDARVGLSKEAFRLLAEEGCARALVLFVPEDDNSNYRFSLITRNLSIDEEGKVKDKHSNPRRFSYIFGTDFKSDKTLRKFFLKQTPEDTRIKRIVDEKDLIERFSVEALTKDFYGKLYQWYLWAVDNATGVTFPNKTSTSDDDRDNMNIKIIRMITRLLFVWFIKQKGLAPDRIFDVDELKHILKDFNPKSVKDGNYYNAILQNLFFATLNRAIIDDEGNPRRFANRKGKRDMRNLYRYPEMFNISEEEVLDLFAKVPFLNGGLFECLDKFAKTDIQQEEDVYYDGFSRYDARFANGNLKYRAFIPNILFFNDDEQQPGLINIFSQYNFTIEENSVDDADVSLDPELLGRVFENLLAAYNPETQESARKATGSFYTPREIVNYMVNESLIAYVNQHCSDIDEKKIRELFTDNEKSDDWTEQQGSEVIKALKDIKILDPACGSGAFPMGCLLRIVGIIECLQGHTENRYELKLHLIENCIFGIDIQPIAMLISKLRFFISLICEQKDIDFSSPETNYGINTLPNLETKFVAANTLIGADIRNFDNDWTQDEKLQQMQKELLSIRSNHFYARSQYKKEKDREADAAKCEEILAYILENKREPDEEKIALLKKQILKYKSDLKRYEGEYWIDEYTQPDMELFETSTPTLFRHDTNKEKRDEINKAIANCEAEIKKEQDKSQLKGFEAAVKQITSWNPYNQNASSPFFDAEWMFGVKDGFNIVIGNPPYIDAKEQLKKESLKSQREKLSKDKRYETLYQKWDLYIAFMEIGIKHFSSKLGLCTMIVPYPLTNQLYAKIMRKLLVDNYDLIELVDLNGTKVFENATVSNCIPLVRNSHTLKETIISKINKDKHIYHAFIQLHKDLIQDKNTLVWNLTQEKHDTNKHANLHVLGDFCYITKGMVLNADEKKAKGEFVKSDLISTISDDIHCKKYIEGKDIDRYSIKRIRFLEWNTKRCPNELSRPTFPELYTNKKLLINALGEMKANIDVNAEFYCEQQVRMALLWKDLSSVSNKSITSSIKKFSTLKRKEMEDLSTKVDLRYLLGIINSQYASVLLSNIRGGDYHIVPEHIRNIPIPLATKEQQHRIAIIVDKILKAKQEDSQADTSKEEKEIDRLVYKLYGLTYDEVKIVAPETSITYEEYDNFKL
jgi:hypothetical protein